MLLRRVFLAGLLAVAVAAEALAHAPQFYAASLAGVAERPAIRDPEKSWALYGRLGPGRTAEMIPIHGKQGGTLFVQIIVPVRSDLNEFRPRGVLIGPGLQGEAPADLPVQVPAGQGVLVLPEPDRRRQIYEGFTQMYLWEYGMVDGKFPETGRYGLVVYDPSGRGGPYTAAIGKREEFGLLDLFTFPLIWARARVWLWR